MKTNSKREYLIVALLMLLVSALVIIGFIAVDAFKDGVFSYKAVTGALLGSFVAYMNYALLCISVDRVLAKIAKERGKGEMSEEEEKAFVEKHTPSVQMAMARALGFRMILMIVILVAAFISKQFNVIATVIPILLQKPITQAVQLGIAKQNEKRGENI